MRYVLWSLFFAVLALFVFGLSHYGRNIGDYVAFLSRQNLQTIQSRFDPTDPVTYFKIFYEEGTGTIDTGLVITSDTGSLMTGMDTSGDALTDSGTTNSDSSVDNFADFDQYFTTSGTDSTGTTNSGSITTTGSMNTGSLQTSGTSTTTTMSSQTLKQKLQELQAAKEAQNSGTNQ